LIIIFLFLFFNNCFQYQERLPLLTEIFIILKIDFKLPEREINLRGLFMNSKIIRDELSQQMHKDLDGLIKWVEEEHSKHNAAGIEEGYILCRIQEDNPKNTKLLKSRVREITDIPSEKINVNSIACIRILLVTETD
jgi:hypothetical protein